MDHQNNIKKPEKEEKEVVYQRWLSDLRWCGLKLEDAPRNIRSDYNLVLSAMQNYGLALEWASPHLQNDKRIVLTAVRQNGMALQFSSPAQQSDEDVVIAAIKSNPDSIKFANESMKRNPDVMIVAGMFDKNHVDAVTAAAAATTTTAKDGSVIRSASSQRKVALSTRFSLSSQSNSVATKFTKLFKEHPYVRDMNFKVYAPNAFDKKTCDPNWTDFDWPCRGTIDTCQFDDVSLKTGHPTDDCCWRYSFRHQLEEAERTGGFMLQLVEFGKLGNGQKIECDMSNSLGLKIFQVHRPYAEAVGGEGGFNAKHVEKLVSMIKNWYDEGWKDERSNDMPISILHPTVDY